METTENKGGGIEIKTDLKIEPCGTPPDLAKKKKTLSLTKAGDFV